MFVEYDKLCLEQERICINVNFVRSLILILYNSKIMTNIENQSTDQACSRSDWINMPQSEKHKYKSEKHKYKSEKHKYISLFIRLVFIYALWYALSCGGYNN